MHLHHLIFQIFKSGKSNKKNKSLNLFINLMKQLRKKFYSLFQKKKGSKLLKTTSKKVKIWRLILMKSMTEPMTRIIYWGTYSRKKKSNFLEAKEEVSKLVLSLVKVAASWLVSKKSKILHWFQISLIS